MKPNKLALVLVLSSGLAVFLAPKFANSTEATAEARSSGQAVATSPASYATASYDAQVRAAVQTQSGPDSQVNVCNASPERVLGGHPGETGFYKAYDVNTANGRVAVYRDKNGIYWHFKGQGEAQSTTGQSATGTVSGSGFIRWGSSGPGNGIGRGSDDTTSRGNSGTTPGVGQQNIRRAPGAPEPSTAALYMLGLLIGSGYLRLRRKQQ